MQTRNGPRGAAVLLIPRAIDSCVEGVATYTLFMVVVRVSEPVMK